MGCERGKVIRRAAVHILFFLIILPCGDSSGQEIRTEFSGYGLNFPIFQHAGPGTSLGITTGGNSFLDLSRIRLRPALFIGENISILLEYEFTGLYSSRDILRISQADTPNRQLTGLRWTITGTDRLRIDNFIDRLSFRYDFPSALLVVGRQRIAWGTGRVWNPTDLFNPINPANFEKIEKDGADAMSFKKYFGDFTDLEVVGNAENEFQRWNGACRFTTNFEEFDVSVMGGRFDGHTVAGVDFAGNFFEAGVRGELLFTEYGGSAGSSVVISAGIDYQFTREFYCLAEYLYNGKGETRTERYDFTKIANGEMLQLGRHYVYLSTTCLLHPLVSCGLSVNGNMNDRSGFLMPQLLYTAGENVDLQLGGLFPFGNYETEYDRYPTSVFLKSTIFF